MNFQGFYNGKQVLITGHTGFKGSWLTEWLLMMGAKVTGLALPPDTAPALFDQLGLAGRCDHRIGDVRDRALVRRLIHEVRPDLVFHLAAQPLVRLSYAQPLETYETNVIGTAHVLDALRSADWPCAAVMITTDKVYENQEQGHAFQESDPLGGYDPYSSSKACAELVIQSYRNSFFNPGKIGLRLTSHTSPREELDVRRKTLDVKSEVADGVSPLHVSRFTSNVSPPAPHVSRFTSHISPPLVAVASARAGNVIGGGDWALDRIVPDCMRALAKGNPILVRNPGSTRPWQHVLEPLSGYLLLGMKLFEELDVRGEELDVRCETLDVKSEVADGVSPLHVSRFTSNVSPPAPHVSPPAPHVSRLTSYASSFNFGPSLSSNRPVRDLVSEILKHWPGRWEDGSDPHAPHEAGLLNLATDKALQVLGWKPRWSFEQTLAATVSWYKAVHERGSGVARELVRAQILRYSERVLK